jgi:hypothetical protein
MSKEVLFRKCKFDTTYRNYFKILNCSDKTNKNHMIISIEIEKALNKIEHTLKIKLSEN